MLLKNISLLKKEDFFISVGRLTKQKNHQLLIDLYKNNRNLKKLIIIGDGELKNKLIKKIKNFNLEKKILIMKFKNNIFDYIKNSSAVIIPSLWEDPGFVMIEAAYLKNQLYVLIVQAAQKNFFKRVMVDFYSKLII